MRNQETTKTITRQAVEKSCETVKSEETYCYLNF